MRHVAGGGEMAGSIRRQAGLGALAVVVLWLAALLGAGAPPAFDASPVEVASYFHDHHRAVVVGGVLFAAGLAIYLGVLCALTIFLRGAAQRALGQLVANGGITAAAVMAGAVVLWGALGELAVTGNDPGLVRDLYELDQFAAVPVCWLTLVAVYAVTLAGHRGVFPTWSVWLNGAIGALLVLGGISVMATGLFAAGTGLFAVAGFLASIVFVAELGVLLWTAKEPVRVAR